MQDFNYLASNDFEITLEFIWAAHWGVKGVVKDANTGEAIAGARVHVRNITRLERHVRMEADINHDVTSARAGDYWRLLTDGEYEIIVQAEGYDSQAKLVQIYNEDHGEATRLDFDLVPHTELPEEDLMREYEDMMSQGLYEDPRIEDYHDLYRP